MAFLDRVNQRVIGIYDLMDLDIEDESIDDMLQIDDMIAPLVEWLQGLGMSIEYANGGGMVDSTEPHTVIEFSNTVVNLPAPKGFHWTEKGTILESDNTLINKNYSERLSQITSNLQVLCDWIQENSTAIKKRVKM
jgi:hypothetical protein